MKKYLKQFKRLTQETEYNQFQCLLISRYCRRYHVSEMFYVTNEQALHYDLKHHIN